MPSCRCRVVALAFAAAVFCRYCLTLCVCYTVSAIGLTDAQRSCLQYVLWGNAEGPSLTSRHRSSWFLWTRSYYWRLSQDCSLRSWRVDSPQDDGSWRGRTVTTNDSMGAIVDCHPHPILTFKGHPQNCSHAWLQAIRANGSCQACWLLQNQRFLQSIFSPASFQYFSMFSVLVLKKTSLIKNK